jgi:exopolyphosphatase / guanosine-5'-triphosphate,3'-diphosphate pyrophosphatase
MKALSPLDQPSAVAASLLLRLARALNLSRSGAVNSTRVRIGQRGVTLTLKPRARASVDLEFWAVEKEKTYFREIFGRELSVAAS